MGLSQIQGIGGSPKAAKVVSPSQLETLLFQQPDIDALRAEDLINDVTKAGPWRFGYNHETNLTLENSGRWYTSANGAKIWVLKIQSKYAQTINLTFENLQIPKGNEMYVYNEDKSFILGSFTENHIYEGQLGTELVPGSVAIVEYYVEPENVNKTASLTINKVTHGYRTAGEFSAKAFGGSGNCNMNANCPDGVDWEQQKRGVVMLVSGSNGFCTGSMINNTANDGKPYVLTANHCYSNPATWIFRFNWESATCANPGSSPTFQSLSGAVLRSRRTPTDFCLVEITGGLENGTVPAAYNTFFSGWDNSGVNPTSTVGIHHPSGDIKKISFDDQASTPVQAMGSNEANSSWSVSWDRNTTTEGGSSGSPLFDQNGRIIGQLWGGGASCSNLSAPDYYGRVNQSWNPTGSTNAQQLKHWLDPSNSGATTTDGYDPNYVAVDNDGGVMSITSPTGTYCVDAMTPSVVIRNYGTATLTSLTLTYSSTGLSPQVYNWTGSLTTGQSATVALPAFTAADGSNTFTVTSSMPNGEPDENTANDVKVSNFTAMENALSFTVKIKTDCYGDESTWEILDLNNTVLYSGGPFSDNTETISTFCLPEGCYKFKMKDSYGDGMSTTSNPWAGCSATNVGYWVNYNGTDLVAMTTANFGTSVTHDFCLGAANPCDGAIDPTVTVSSTVSSGTNGTATVSASAGVAPYTYSWTGPNGYTSSNSAITGLVPGTYTVTVTDACDGEATQTIEVLSSVGISAIANGVFKVFPNPSEGRFTIEFNQLSGSTYSIHVMDLTGRTVYSTEGNELKKEINLKGVTTGKYILNVRTENGSFNQSIMIKN